MEYCWRIFVSILDFVIFMRRKCAKHFFNDNNVTLTNVNGSVIIVIS